MSGTALARFTVPASHPALPGHFPGRPIVPGVVLLDRVIAAARDAFGRGPASGLPRAKFLAPVLPEQEVTAEMTLAPSGRLGFTCRVADRVVASGELDLAP